MSTQRILGLALAAAVWTAPVSDAALILEAIGTGTPANPHPGSYTMFPLVPTAAPGTTTDTIVIGQLAGDLTLSTPAEVRSVAPPNLGSPYWATWSHGFTGDVYWTGTGTGAIQLDFPTETAGTFANARAFDFYVEPNWLGTVSFDITVAPRLGNQSEELLNVDIGGNGGAVGFRTYFDFTDNNDRVNGIETILITANPGAGTPPLDFAFGELAIGFLPTGQSIVSGSASSLSAGLSSGSSHAVPEPAPALLLGAGLLALAVKRRRAGHD